MKITKKQLKYLIERSLKETRTGPMQGSPGGSNNSLEDDFELTDDMLDPDQSAHEEYVSAVDAYRNPEKPIGNMPHFSFGNKQGVTSTTQGTHIPSDNELGHVRRYQAQEIGGSMPSVHDYEVTVPNFGEGEVTEESPFGTQYSLEKTKPQYRYSDRTLTDPGDTAKFDDDEYLDSDDDTDEEEEVGLLQKIKAGYKKIQQKYF
tara:strand:+ start:59 stop:670 length:612 start_codon:yes stop_codon:yes gene_type:complete